MTTGVVASPPCVAGLSAMQAVFHLLDELIVIEQGCDAAVEKT